MRRLSAKLLVTVRTRELHTERQRGLRVLQYLRGTRNVGLDVEVYSIADCARDNGVRRSVTGSVVLCRKSLASWTSTAERHVATSTAQAEHIAIVGSIKHASFISNALVFLLLSRERECMIVHQFRE